jgi:C-terminal processing protease CtpA/Prc
MDSAMYGLVESLDSESYFIKGKDLEQYKKDIEALEKQAGVGLTISRRFGMVVVVAVEKGSPAEEKKIKAGDFIRSVNGEYVQGIPLYRIYQQMKGNPGISYVDLPRSPTQRATSFNKISDTSPCVIYCPVSKPRFRKNWKHSSDRESKNSSWICEVARKKTRTLL